MNWEPVLIFSSGIYAGLGTTVSLVAGPAVLASRDPLPAWKLLYQNGAKTAVTTILVQSISGLAVYFASNKPDPRYLIAAGMTFINIPFTILVMGNNIKTLQAMDATENNDGEIRRRIEKWTKQQWVRTALGVSAFAITIAITVCKKH